MPTARPTRRVTRPVVRPTNAALLLGLMTASIALFCGCANKPPRQPTADAKPPSIWSVNLNDSVAPDQQTGPIILAAAKNEWTNFVLDVGSLTGQPTAAKSKGRGYSLRLQPLNSGNGGTTIPAGDLEVYQVLSMPVDVNRAGYVRHTGLSAESGRLPRALLPVAQKDGLIDLSTLRDPANPLDPAGRAGASKGGPPLLLWVDLRVPADAPAGEYQAACDLLPAGAAANAKPLATVPVKLTVHDFALPDERHLQMISQLDWKRQLAVHYQQDFETVTPRLLNRTDERYAGTIAVLDSLVALAQHHRLALIVPDLEPTVKWPAKVDNAPPEVDWRDYDSVVTPWLSGAKFADKIPLDYWPLPEPEYLQSYDPESLLAYWRQAATHFDQNDWLDSTSVAIGRSKVGRATAGDSIELSAEAAQILSAHPRVRVTVPLEDDQIQIAGPINPRLVDPITLPRVLTASPGLVYAPPPQGWEWPEEVRDDPKRQPSHWLRTDVPGLVPYAGAGGDERDVRLWSWLSFLRRAKFVMFGHALPSASDPNAPADPNELIWFYPGSWFGVDEPVPSVQLKWLRRASQDYEYLWLAQERGEATQAFQIARLITKPVKIQPGQAPDETYALMCGTADAKAWVDAKRLLAQTIQMRTPGKAVDPAAEQELYGVTTLIWAVPQERPVLLGRTSTWNWSSDQRGGRWVDLRVGLDIYNARDIRPEANQLRWISPPAGWEVSPRPVEVPALDPFHVRRDALAARVNLDKVTPGTRLPVRVEFRDGHRNTATPVELTLPVAVSERREGRFRFDGKLDDWQPLDAIHQGPMVQMLNRPDLQAQTTRPATTKSQLFSGWANDNFYLAFDLEGLSNGTDNGRNFVSYQNRRTWGEDLCELLIQPVYEDGGVGPILHVVCKPNGSTWVERKLDPRLNANPWEPFEGTGVRYARTLSGNKWTGEVAIPWQILNNPRPGSRLSLLRFNFAQHRTATGESASWAGPIDFGRDDAFMGLIYLHLPDVPDLVERPEKFLGGPRPVER